MKIKARIGSQSCPQKYWDKTSEVEVRQDIPEEIIAEIIALWPDLKTGRAKDQRAKKSMIEIYNTLHNTNYSTATNCGSCIAACFDGIKKIYKEYSGNN
jgi:NAD-dependent dihydropyrimidine dehydrogenase PreA subunit